MLAAEPANPAGRCPSRAESRFGKTRNADVLLSIAPDARVVMPAPPGVGLGPPLVAVGVSAFGVAVGVLGTWVLVGGAAVGVEVAGGLVLVGNGVGVSSTFGQPFSPLFTA